MLCGKLKGVIVRLGPQGVRYVCRLSYEYAKLIAYFEGLYDTIS